MSTISSSDVLFATVSQRGNMLLNIKLCGVESESDIYRAIRMSLPGISGIARLSIRNASRGWSAAMAHLFR